MKFLSSVDLRVFSDCGYESDIWREKIPPQETLIFLEPCLITIPSACCLFVLFNRIINRLPKGATACHYRAHAGAELDFFIEQIDGDVSA